MNYTKKTLRSLGMAAAFSLLGTAAFASVVKTPYMIYPGNNTQMEVLWQDSAIETTNTLTWGTDPTFATNIGSQTVLEYGGAHQHMYTINGLNPDQTYYYQVSDTTNGIYGTGSFITAPAATSTHVKFIGMGDSRSQPSAMDSIQQAIKTFYNQSGNAEYRRLVMHNGDWVSSDNDSYWTEQWFGPSATSSWGLPIGSVFADAVSFRANSPINGCKGNHDNNSSYPNGNSIYFPKYYPYPYQHTTVGGVATPFDPATVQAYSNLYYSFDYGPVHFTIVDNYSNLAPGSAQYNWVQSDLAAASANPNTQWKLMIYHEPAYSAGSDSENVNVRNLEPFVTQYGVDLIYSGHSHNYARTGAYSTAQAGGDTIALNVPHIVSGGGGAPVYQPDMTNAGSYSHVITAWPAFEFMAFDVEGKTLTMTAYQVNGVSPTALPSTTLNYTPIETVVLNHFTNVSPQVSVKTGGIIYNRATQLYNTSMTVTNTGSTPLNGNVHVVMDGLLDLNQIGASDNQYSTASPKISSKIAAHPGNAKGITTAYTNPNVTLANATGSNNGEPMIRVSTTGLAAGASVTVPVSFKNPTNAPINFNPVTYQE
jgi:predicted phosphodiesterase